MTAKKNVNLIILTLCLVIIVDSIGMSLVYPVLAPLFNAAEGGILPAGTSIQVRGLLYGITMSIFPVLMFIGAPLMGDLSDHYGRKKVLLICLFGEAAGLLVTGISVTVSSVELLLAARAFSGLMAANMPIAQAAVIDVSTDDNKIINISMIGLSNTLGFILGPLVSGFLSDKSIGAWMGFSTPFYISALLAVINGAILMLVFHESFVRTETKKINIFSGAIMFFSAFKIKQLRTLSLVYLVNGISWNFYIAFIALFLVQKYGYTSTDVGYFISWVAFILSLSLLFIVRIVVKYFSLKQITAFSFIWVIVGILLAFDESIAMQWVSSALIASGVGIAYSTLLTLLSNAADKDKQGLIMGISGAIYAASAGIAGLMISAVAMLPYAYSFLSMLALWVITLLIFFRYKKDAS